MEADPHEREEKKKKKKKKGYNNKPSEAIQV